MSGRATLTTVMSEQQHEDRGAEAINVHHLRSSAGIRVLRDIASLRGPSQCKGHNGRPAGSGGRCGVEATLAARADEGRPR